MAHRTTLPTHVHTAVSSPARVAVDPQPGTGGPSVDVEGQRFRVRTAKVSTPWLPHTPSNHHLAVVWCRLLVDEHGKPLCTVQA
jgi:hypothetical protein